jgi:V/A-type H+-transporting ATPase subunit E
MKNHVAVETLEDALLARAQALAAEYSDQAKLNCERIQAELAERLRLREEREVQAAKIRSEREFRRLVQVAEIRMQAELDRERWHLVEQVMTGLRERLEELAQDEERYAGLFTAFLAQGAAAIERENLVAEVNARDLDRLRGSWEQFVRETVPGKQIRLATEPKDCTGGVLVRSEGGRIQVDNTFEGRMDRMLEDLQRVIMERLFVSAPHMNAFFKG